MTTLRKAIGLSLVLAMVAQLFVPALAFAQAERRVEVTAKSLNMRAGPGTDYDKVGAVRAGDVLLVIREQPGWLQVELPNGDTGWVSTRYVRPAGSGQPEPQTPPPTQPEPEPARTPPPPPPPQQTYGTRSSGGSFWGPVITWGSLLGAGVFGYLAYSERSKGDDTYDEYVDFANDGDEERAEEKWEETADHDDKAKIYMGVAGGLGAIFLIKVLFFRGSGSGSASLLQDGPEALASMPIQFDPVGKQVRAGIVLAKF